MKYYSCSMTESFFLNFNGRIDTEENSINLCCEPAVIRPAVGFGKTPEETVDHLCNMRNGIIRESRRFAIGKTNRKRQYTAGCANCANYSLNEWKSDGKIHYVNFSMYPAPCQCKCIYCSVHKGEDGKYLKSAEPAYERLFDTLDYIKKKGMIAPDATWQISSGEITIHPYKDRILDLVAGQRAIFYTNCFKFDERISRNLKENPYSAIICLLMPDCHRRGTK